MAQNRASLTAALGLSALLLPLAGQAAESCQEQVLKSLAGQAFSYQIHWKSFDLDSSRTLERLGNGQWQLDNSASLLFFKIEENSHFRLEQGQLQGIDYHYKRQGMNDKKDLDIAFEQGGFKATTWRGTEETKAQDSVFDPLNYQLQMQLDLSCAQDSATYSYPLARYGEVRPYQFKQVGTESVVVPAGTFDTIVMEKQDNGDKIDRIWLAPKLKYSIVKLIHQEEGDEAAELTLQKAPKL